MYDPEMRKDCPMRGNLGNCSPVGGFCMDAVSDEICEAVHNAYFQGLYDMLKEQEPIAPVYDQLLTQEIPRCGKCGYRLVKGNDKYCCRCGQAVKWNDK